MSTLRQPCPQCGRALELPESAAGRKAKCPACEATFVVGESAPPRVSAAQPAYGAALAMPNPYQPNESLPPVAVVGDVTIVQRSMEEIFSLTLSIFTARWLPLVMAPLLVGVLGVVVTVIPLTVLGFLAGFAGDVVVVIGMVLLAPLMLFVSGYLMVGLTRVTLAVARNHPTPMSELIAPVNLVIKMILAILIVLIAVGGAALILGGGLVGLAMVAGGQEAASVTLVLLILVLSLASVLLQWLVWPLPFIISDGKSTVTGSIRAAYQMAMHNKLTSFLLVLISFVLSMIGTSLCYVGQIVTVPLTMLLFAVAYLLMSNQLLSDPRTVGTEADLRQT